MAKKRVVRRKRAAAPGKPRRRRRMSGLQPAVVSGVRRKKRRIGSTKGSITGNLILDALIGTGLGVGGGIVIDAVMPSSIDKKVVDGIKVVGGAAIAYTGNKSKNPAVMGFGLGLAGQGMGTGAKNFGIIKGVTDFMNGIGNNRRTNDTMLIEMNGINSDNNGLPVMNSLPQGASVISGDMPPVVSGF